MSTVTPELLATSSNTPAQPSGPRFHDLDAFRAWAVLLGIVLHVAWLMLPYRLATPIVDSDHHPAAAWLFTFIHFFRMQAFFLVAGFFANLVYSKRGLGAFTKNRAIRIGIPLVLGAILFVPWMRFYHAWGGRVGGATLSGDSLTALWWSDLQLTYSTNIPLVHLWFLWDLILLYALALSLKLAMDKTLDRERRFRDWFQQLFCSMLKSPANILLLAVPSACLLLPMKYWLGVEGYPTWLVPDWYGFLSYWIFFSVGWMLYFNRELLPVFSIRWKTNLLLGLLLSFPIWGAYENYVRVHVNGSFPALGGSAIVDYPAVREQLLSTASNESPNSIATTEATREIWQRLSPEWQQKLSQANFLSVNELEGLATELTRKVVFGEPLTSAGKLNTNTSEPTTREQTAVDNRLALGAVFRPAITAPIERTPVAWALKAIFCAFYGITMWLLVFGFMGLFQTYFQNPSPAARYLSDSSYWLYLLHLPILFWLAMYLTPIELGFLGKFAAYNILAVLILLPSYHYLVRSTPIGQLLNGRAYPYRGFFNSDLFISNFPTENLDPQIRAGAERPSGEAQSTPSTAGDFVERPRRNQNAAVEDCKL